MSSDVRALIQNGPVPAVAQVLELAQLVERDAAWKLLRADSAPTIAGLLGIHLGGDERRVDAEELYERIDADLERLRAQGIALPLTAKGTAGSGGRPDSLCVGRRRKPEVRRSSCRRTRLRASDSSRDAPRRVRV